MVVILISVCWCWAIKLADFIVPSTLRITTMLTRQSFNHGPLGPGEHATGGFRLPPALSPYCAMLWLRGRGSLVASPRRTPLPQTPLLAGPTLGQALVGAGQVVRRMARQMFGGCSMTISHQILQFDCQRDSDRLDNSSTGRCSEPPDLHTYLQTADITQNYYPPCTHLH